jgi:hypothetical protein
VEEDRRATKERLEVAAKLERQELLNGAAQPALPASPFQERDLRGPILHILWRIAPPQSTIG